MFLGVDIGTSSVKAILVDESGIAVEQASIPMEVHRPRPGWSEQSPQDWWRAVEQAVVSLDPELRSAVRAIGLSGQMHGATLLDVHDHVLRPAILWNDGRSAIECAELEAVQPDSRRITGNLAMPGFTAPKLLWVRKHEPQVFRATHAVLLPKDYVRLVMTGEKATDRSDASGTLWLDVAAREWSPRMLAATALSEAHMPRLFEGPEITGQLRAEVAVAWGMQRVPVVAGGGDNAAGAIGVGVINDGEALLSLGTSGVLFVAGSAFRPNPAQAVHAFCHALPHRWHLMSVMLSAASAVEWAAHLTRSKDVATFIAQAEGRGKMDGEEMFLPYLSGERTPHNDPQARGVLLGLTHDSDAAAVAQAVLEGVAFAFVDGLEALEGAGTQVTSISLIGGGARSLWWGKVIASALNRRLVVREGAEVGPAFGAARLAQLGVTRLAIEEVCKPPPVRTVLEPDALHSPCLALKRTRFAKLYPALRERAPRH